jgi:uncharacterized phage-associated protein
MNGYDVRTVANIVLRRAALLGVEVTNLHLNKALFFMHVDFMRETDMPLVSAKIEAWQYGPVFREIYNQFKRFDRNPITEPAVRVSVETGEFEIATDSISDDTLDFLESLADYYLRVPTGVLIDVSHAKGGAWDAVWSKSEAVNAGMEITEQIIRKFEIPFGKRIKLQ